MNRSICVLLLVLSLASLPAVCPAAEESDQHRLTLTTSKVIVFKDGYSLIIKRGIGTSDANGELYTNEVPDSAVLGSFWATPKEGRMVSMIAGWTEATTIKDTLVDCTQTIEVLRANIGKKCSIQLSDKSILTGGIAKVLTQPTSSPLTERNRVSFGVSLPAGRNRLSAGPRLVQSHVIDGVVGSQFVLKTEEGDVLIPAARIQRLTIKDMKTAHKRTVTTKAKTKRLTFRMADRNKRHDLMLMYFRPGVRWVPTYRISLATNAKKQKLAKIVMQAEIINEAEDLIDTPIDIVVGVPNFRFRNSVSPLVLEQTLRNALAQAAPVLQSQFRNDFSNSIYSQRSAPSRRSGANATAAAGGTVQLPGELTAGGAQDLFVYNLPRMKLRKGERAAVHVLTTEVPYRDVYTWDLHIKRNDIAVAPSGSGVNSPLVLSKNRVWRQIELVNNTKLPWTTGTAMIMQGQQPLAQELLTYTSPTDACRVPVTVSVDTRGSFLETETARQLQSLRWNRYHYAKIQQRATLDLCNNKSETINAEITFRFGGKADSVSNDGSLTLAPYRADDWSRYRGDPAVNNSSVVKWKVTLKPGDTFKPTVDYHFFTRQ